MAYKRCAHPLICLKLLLLIVSEWKVNIETYMRLSCVSCCVCCVQNYEPAFNLWCDDLCVELPQKKFECGTDPDRVDPERLSGHWLQELTNLSPLCVAGLGPDPHFLPADLPMPPSSTTPEPLPPMSAHDHFGVARSMGMTPFSQSLPSSGPHHHPPELTSSEVWWRLAMEQQQQHQLFQLRQDDWQADVWRPMSASLTLVVTQTVRTRLSEQVPVAGASVKLSAGGRSVKLKLIQSSAEGFRTKNCLTDASCLMIFSECLVTSFRLRHIDGRLVSQDQQKVSWLCVDWDSEQQRRNWHVMTSSRNDKAKQCTRRL